MTVCRKILRPFTDSRDLLIDLKRNSLLISFLMLLVSLFFYELYRMGSSSIIYLYLHRYGFDDVLYAAYFTIEQLANCIALLCLALLRNRWKTNDLYLCIFGLCLSLIGPMLFAFAQENKRMIFGGKISSVFISMIDICFRLSAIPSSMFTVYFTVCLRAIIAHLVPDRDKGFLFQRFSFDSIRFVLFCLGKAFAFVAFIQNFDVVIGTIACTEIYRASISTFSGSVFIFAAATRVVALILIM